MKAIEKHLGVSRSSVSRWVQDIVLLPEQMERLKTNVERGRLTRLTREEAKRDKEREEARTSYEKFKGDPLFMSGLVGYWAEGIKHEVAIVSVANTNPAFLCLMMEWLMRYGGVHHEDFTLRVYMHTDLSTTEEECRRFWEQRLAVPVAHFHRKENKHKNFRRRRPYNGTAYLRVRRCQRLFIRITEWLRCLQSEWCAPVAQSDRASHF